jgi:hypothetical protein
MDIMDITGKIKKIKEKYDAWDVNSVILDKTVFFESIYSVVIDKNDLIYASSAWGSDILVYNKRGELVKRIDQIIVDGAQKIMPRLMVYNHDENKLIVLDYTNDRIHSLTPDGNLVEKTFDYSLNKKISAFENTRLVSLAIGTGAAYLYLLKPEFSEKSNGAVVKLIAIDGNMMDTKVIFEFNSKAEDASKFLSVFHDASEKAVYILYAANYIFKIAGDKCTEIFDASRFGLVLSSICLVDDCIYATVIRGRANVIKLTKEGELIFYFKHRDIENAVCLAGSNGFMAVASRGNNRIVILERGVV